ncbi:glycosyltransferase [bacterium]|nr:glycosyltransferase [bacterium]
MSILSVLTAVYAMLVLFFFVKNKSVSPSGKIQKATIIVAARNEESVIDNCLRSLSEQNYPENLLEILVVDDNSTDKTGEIIQQWTTQDSRIISLKTPEKRKYRAKKAPLDFAIRQAKGDIILITDADCTQKPNWAQTMVKSFREDTVALSGLAAIKRGEKAVQIFQRLDFLLLMVANRGMADANYGLAGCGMNLGFRKDAFFAVGGFEKIKNMLGGDDTVLLQEMQKITGKKIHFAHSQETFVKTESQPTWSELFRQRLRWAVDGLHQVRQNPMFFVLLLVLAGAHFFGILLPVYLAMGFKFFWGFFAIWAMKIFADIGIFWLSKIWFEEPVSLKEFVVWWFINPIYYTITTVLSPLGNKVRWK